MDNFAGFLAENESTNIKMIRTEIINQLNKFNENFSAYKTNEELRGSYI